LKKKKDEEEWEEKGKSCRIKKKSSLYQTLYIRTIDSGIYRDWWTPSCSLVVVAEDGGLGDYHSASLDVLLPPLAPVFPTPVPPL